MFTRSENKDVTKFKDLPAKHDLNFLVLLLRSKMITASSPGGTERTAILVFNYIQTKDLGQPIEAEI